MTTVDLISSSINRTIAQRFMSPDEKAVQAATMGLVLDLPMDIANKRAAAASLTEPALDKLKDKIRDARASYAEAVAANNAGTGPSYAVTDADNELRDLVDELDHLRAMRAGTRKFQRNMQDIVNDIQMS